MIIITSAALDKLPVSKASNSLYVIQCTFPNFVLQDNYPQSFPVTCFTIIIATFALGRLSSEENYTDLIRERGRHSSFLLCRDLVARKFSHQLSNYQLSKFYAKFSFNSGCISSNIYLISNLKLAVCHMWIIPSFRFVQAVVIFARWTIKFASI